MKSTRKYGLLALLWLTLSAVAAFGTPIVHVSNLGQDYNILGGGAFHATVNGVNVELYCVDWQNSIANSSYDAFLSTSNDYSAARFGTTAATAFQVEPVTPNLTAIQRYTMAAWLITQLSLQPANITQDTYRQEAIWNLLTQSGATNVPGYGNSNVNALITAALAYKDDATLRSELRIITTADTNGYNTGGQELMYLTPEPATFALIGIGLAGVALIRRRRA